MPVEQSSPSAAQRPPHDRRWQFWIDRGGTFTDVVAQPPSGPLLTTKLLSENPQKYADAAVAGIRKILQLDASDVLPLSEIASIRMGTTVATNALLERKGEPTALLITQGFADQLRIGHQSRPELFALNVQLPSVLQDTVAEVQERVSANGAVLLPLCEASLRQSLKQLKTQGYKALAIVFLHSWCHPQHEARAAKLARDMGFAQISVSHEVSPLMKVVPRGQTTVADAYLSPILYRYVEQLERALLAGQPKNSSPSTPVYFIKSNGGLVLAEQFRGKDSVLSGPAGGIVGMVRTALAAGLQRLIGFDMGGTSTDVSHFAGSELEDCERVFDSVVAGIPMQAPMLSIHTIAAGGGSLLHFDGQRLRVGPDSAGSNPGPVCYRRGGSLALTDANLLLGRIQPDFFPKIFGVDGRSSLDSAAVAERFKKLAGKVSEGTGRRTHSEEVAEGFIRVAVSKMAEAIAFISVQRGYDLNDYTLVCFGGAGGQHACAVAEQLGIKRIFLHPLSGVLSAYGMGLADVTASRQQAIERQLSPTSCLALHELLEQLGQLAQAEVQSQGFAPRSIKLRTRVYLKYAGTDTTLAVATQRENTPCSMTEMHEQFESQYRQRFSFLMPGTVLIIESVSVEAIGSMQTASVAPSSALHPQLATNKQPAQPTTLIPLYAQGTWHQAPLVRRKTMAVAQAVLGPALIVEDNTTVVIEPGWTATLAPEQHLLLEQIPAELSTGPNLGSNKSTAVVNTRDPVLLELCSNRFMSIAEQMGVTLANTAHSVNIKERLDFSCALFDAQGELVANAPHVPVHLGSMSASIKTVIERNRGSIQKGDAYALNDPYNGGTHLPDITVVMPLFCEQEPERLLFYVAARGHHADVGGTTPGSMPPTSRTVQEEGVLIDNFRIVHKGQLAEAEFRALMGAARYPARNIPQNLADLRAQVAACEKGREQLQKMVRQFSLPVVQTYMGHVQDNAEESVRRVLARLEGGKFCYAMDDGAQICVEVRVDQQARTADVDFSGTSAQRDNNFNTPPAVVQAAVLYVFRTLVDEDIPLNAGCLRPITLTLPAGSMLRPQYPAATVAGNVETSQCIVDALYGALNVMAASQGTMNNFTFGNDSYQYYETLAGGSGAGNGFDGTAAVQTHMTNSRLTDPEVIEHRFPVVIDEHSIRSGTGGAGEFRGGEGVLRRIRFLAPLTAAILAGRRIVAPYGMAGGQPGALGSSWVERNDGSRHQLSSCEEVSLEAGDVFVISTPSGGGYGTPS